MTEKEPIMTFEEWKAIFVPGPESEKAIREVMNITNEEQWKHVLDENYEIYTDYYYGRPGNHKIVSTGKSE